MTALAIASAAASAGGAFMNSSSQASNQAAAINAKNQDTAKLISQENALQGQATNVFQNELNNDFTGSAPANNLQGAQTAATNAISANAPTAAALSQGVTSGNAPKVVEDAKSSTIANRVGQIGQFGQNLGNLTGYDTNNSGNARSLSDTKNAIGTIGNFANEDANVGAATTQADVNNSQKAPSPFGDILSGVGKIGGAYAGANGAFGNLFGTPAGTNGVTMNLGPYGSVTGATPAIPGWL